MERLYSGGHEHHGIHRAQLALEPLHFRRLRLVVVLVVQRQIADAQFLEIEVRRRELDECVCKFSIDGFLAEASDDDNRSAWAFMTPVCARSSQILRRGSVGRRRACRAASRGPDLCVGPTAMHKRALQMLFAFILVSLTTYNLWVSTRQPVWQWGGLTTPPDNLWTIATLIDAYYRIHHLLCVGAVEGNARPAARAVVRRHHASRQYRDVGLRAAPARAPRTDGLHGTLLSARNA